METMSCTSCGKPVSNTARICENCGQEIIGARAEATVPIPADLLDLLNAEIETSELVDPEPEEEEETYGRKGTRNFEVLLDRDQTQSFGRVVFEGTLVLSEEESGKQFRISNAEMAEIHIGRADPNFNHYPTIDLTHLGGEQNGVSRSHATLEWRDDVLVLIDHHSLNGTYINSKRIVPEKPRVVRDGDTIQFSGVRLSVAFEKAATAASGNT